MEYLYQVYLASPGLYMKVQFTSGRNWTKTSFFYEAWYPGILAVSRVGKLKLILRLLEKLAPSLQS